MTNRFGIPKQCFTDDPDNLFGESRVQVDIAQTGFFTGHEFRSYYEFSIAAAASITIRFISPVEVILFNQHITISQSSIKVEAIINGTPAGTYSTSLPIIGKNRMLSRPEPYYESQATMMTGGTVSGGTVMDIMLASVGTQGNQAQASQSDNINDERGLPAGTYYLRITNTGSDTCTGVYSLWWEERP